MLGLFDQPVPREVFDALIAPPAIPGLTDGIAAAEVRATQWNEAIARLREQGLISPASGDAPGALDCHPLVREYFGQRLAQIDRTAFKAAHSRLYDHYRYAGLPAAFCEPVTYSLLAYKAAFPEGDNHERLEESQRGAALGKLTKPSANFLHFQARSIAQSGGADWRCGVGRALAAFLPANEAEMSPLFAAIAHGCAAEREDETLRRFIGRASSAATRTFRRQSLGFTARSWRRWQASSRRHSQRLHPGLRRQPRAATEHCGLFIARAWRLEDAAAPMRATVSAYRKLRDSENSSGAAGNLSELLVTIGLLFGEAGAVAAAEAAVAFADRSGAAFR